MSKIPMNFRIEEDMVRQLKKVAEYENRSLTNLIETELKRVIESHPALVQEPHRNKSASPSRSDCRE